MKNSRKAASLAKTVRLNKTALLSRAALMAQAAALSLIAPQIAWAADGDADASAGGSMSLGGGSFETSTEANGSAPSTGETPWMKRYLPEAMTWEVGLHTGVLFPSKGAALKAAPMAYQGYETAAFELGGRLAFYPLSFLGFEGEFMLADGRIPNDLNSVGAGHTLRSNRANFHAYRAHVIAQLPFYRLVPFVVAGGGVLGQNSQPHGRDTDGAIHFGVGAKLALTQDFSLRLDLRENMGPRVNDNYGSIAFSEEILLGGTFTFGRKPAPLPPEQPDSDGDNVPDDADKCPDVAALTADGCPLDTDGDGVADPDDYCPREAGSGANGCPDLDTDQDSVPLPCDKCPEEAGVAPDGCPIRDRDGDGIFDDKDQCIDEPETKNGFEDADGCPDEIPKEVEKFTGSIEGITFVAGSATIAATSNKTLKAAADVLIKYPSLRIEVSGHTSSEGAREFNQKLSEDRAQAVRQWLVDNGVTDDRITSRGAGPDEPVADNNTPAGRAKNRRIEFRILQN